MLKKYPIFFCLFFFYKIWISKIEIYTKSISSFMCFRDFTVCGNNFGSQASVQQWLHTNALSVLMLCAPISCRQLCSYSSSIFVFCPFSRENNWPKLRKVYWIWQVATVRSINHNVGTLKRTELPDITINTGAQSINTENFFRDNCCLTWQKVVTSCRRY